MKRAATLIIAALCLGGCKRPPQRHCAEFDAAEARFNELTAQILDPTFGDPRFGEAASLFEAVPEDCERRETGLTIARAIREGLAKRRAEAAAAAAAPPPPPPPIAAPPSAPAEAEAAPPMPKVPAPPPVEADDEAPSAEQCAAVAADYRAKCPGECRARKLRDNDAECRQACEQALAAIFQVGGCPPPEPLTQPAAPPPKSAPPPSKKRAPPSDSKHMTYCAYFLPDGEHHVSDCWPLPLAEAQRSCDERLKAQKIEGTCACNDDPAFMGDRCK